jgi:hypothetical protein
MSTQQCSAGRLLALYKDQALSERAHHLLEGPIAVRPVFLKSNRRAAALITVCSLALLLLRPHRERSPPGDHPRPHHPRTPPRRTRRPPHRREHHPRLRRPGIPTSPHCQRTRSHTRPNHPRSTGHPRRPRHRLHPPRTPDRPPTLAGTGKTRLRQLRKTGLAEG